MGRDPQASAYVPLAGTSCYQQLSPRRLYGRQKLDEERGSGGKWIKNKDDKREMNIWKEECNVKLIGREGGNINLLIMKRNEEIERVQWSLGRL